jgi:hypothetical protein
MRRTANLIAGSRRVNDGDDRVRRSGEIVRSKIGTKVHRAKPLKGGRRARAASIVNDHLYLQVARALKKEIVGGGVPGGSATPNRR